MLDLRCRLSKLHNHYGQCFPLPLFAKTAPSSWARCQVKIQPQYLHTSQQTTSIIIISHSTVFYQQLHYLPIWTKIWDSVHAKTYLAPWTTGVTVCLLVIDNPAKEGVWHCPSDSKLPTYSELRSKSYIGIIIENWSALRGTLYKKIGSIEFLIEMLMVDTQNTIQHSSAPRGALIC